MNITEFKRQPVMGILRGIEDDCIEPIIEAVIESGLRTIELTMNTPNAAKLIRQTITLGTKLTIGAGTVLTMDSLHSALDAGATFIVLPTLEPPTCTSRESSSGRIPRTLRASLGLLHP